MRQLLFGADEYNRVRAHLFPGDNEEAAAILVCGVAGSDDSRFCVREVVLVPYDACIARKADRLSWSGDYLDKALDLADAISGGLILMHSHPSGMREFSAVDDASDQLVVPCLRFGASNPRAQFGSAVMTPDGMITARVYCPNNQPLPIDRVRVVGHDIEEVGGNRHHGIVAFTNEMASNLADKTVAVIGVSGTGSITAEMLARLGVGRIVLVDFDRIERKNLNRILYATPADVGRHKTHVLRDAIRAHHPDAAITTIEADVTDPRSIRACGDADVIFCCVDSMQGRLVCDRMTQAFICPLIDMGVMIPTRKLSGEVSVADVCGRVDYVRPGGASLWDRGVITGEGLHEEYIRAVDPDGYEAQLADGYLQGLPEEAPAVISLNAYAASAAVNEWLARLYRFRHADNALYSRTYFSLAAVEQEVLPEPDASERSEVFGIGFHQPLLGLCHSEKPERAVA